MIAEFLFFFGFDGYNAMTWHAAQHKKVAHKSALGVRIGI